MRNNSGTVKLGLISISSFAVANMIGSGVFTSLGFQLAGGIYSVFALLMLWIVGGLTALFGALVYGELGAAMPRSGGEYHYLSKIYHPALGFLSGWVSMTIGFAAPVALACMALGSYLAKVFPMLQATGIAVTALFFITMVHVWSVRVGSRFQNLFTLLKVLLILVFVFCGLTITPEMQHVNVLPETNSWKQIFSPAFAISLIYVSYSYSGWNASAYIAGEIKNPQKLLPKSLLLSTLAVTILYVLLNYTFLQTTPINSLSGQLEVGIIASQKIFGTGGGNLMGILISILLVSSISSMVFVGPRVSQVMGEDIKIFGFLSHKNQRGVPVYAVLFQFFISMLFIVTGSFEQVLTYSGFVLNIFTFLTVLGVFVHRYKFKNAERPYKTWGYPIVPILFLALVSWTMYFLLIEKTTESLYGLATLLLGALIYFANHKYAYRNK